MTNTKLKTVAIYTISELFTPDSLISSFGGSCLTEFSLDLRYCVSRRKRRIFSAIVLCFEIEVSDASGLIFV